MKAVLDFVDYNRNLLVFAVVGLLLAVCVNGCTPLVESPFTPGKIVDSAGLQTEFKVWEKSIEAVQIEFEAAGQDLTAQAERNEKLLSSLNMLRTGDYPGFLTFMLTGGGIGAVVDNVRKRGVIAGLKRNKA